MENEIEPNPYAEEKKKTNWKKIPGVISGIVLICLALGIIWYYFGDVLNQRDEGVDKNIYYDEGIALGLCNKITSTPTWIQNEEIIDNGYKQLPQDEMKEIVDALIEQEIYFMYSDTCSWCHEQIEDFGYEWERYEKSGLTIDCLEVW